jgi:hypothetical protein
LHKKRQSRGILLCRKKQLSYSNDTLQESKMTTPLTWHDVLAEEKQQPYFVNTLKTVAEERQSGSPSIRRKKMSSMRFVIPNWAMSKW